MLTKTLDWLLLEVAEEDEWWWSLLCWVLVLPILVDDGGTTEGEEGPTRNEVSKTRRRTRFQDVVSTQLPTPVVGGWPGKKRDFCWDFQHDTDAESFHVFTCFHDLLSLFVSLTLYLDLSLSLILSHSLSLPLTLSSSLSLSLTLRHSLPLTYSLSLACWMSW